MCVLDNNNGRNDTPQLSQSTKYDKLILTSDPPNTRAAWPPHSTERSWTNKQIDSVVSSVCTLSHKTEWHANGIPRDKK